ncbi:hypothetical protein MMC13_006805 [Lambiella insularis]|nr:hypothetical protein [Lambiella insularis]
MAGAFPTLKQCAIVATAFKVLLFPAYKSTDFEVHRNWLALTHSLPLQQWYYENSSEWTLDYPPFFAYFEYCLSHLAKYADPRMLDVRNLGYESWQTVYFQRATVICTELVLVYALHKFVKTSPSPSTGLLHAAALSILLSPGLLIIDHIHFQYNGFLYGLLVLSLVMARQDSTLLWSGILFAALLCLKHIYLYLAPAYFVYMLRVYCLSQRSVFRIRFYNCARLAGGLAVVFGAALGPFLYLGQMDQLRRRLFPFSRGLCHAYWAPNIWAMYSFADRLLILVAPRLGLHVNAAAVNSVTRGLVGDTSFAVLPGVSAKATFVLTVTFQMICLIKLFVQPTWDTFIGAVTLCGYASFLFGWHVHEKAILLIIIPFSLIALKDRRYLGAFRPLAVAGHVSLFPLLFTTAEFPIKTIYTVFWLVTFLYVFDRLAPVAKQPRVFVLDRFSLLYITVAIPLIFGGNDLKQISHPDKSRWYARPANAIQATASLQTGEMVLFKRKPVTYTPRPAIFEDQEIWVIEATEEVFTNYNDYLTRMEYYKQKRFICEITGHSGMDFFAALQSENEASHEIDDAFPDSLREPILRKVQFSTKSRIDNLVDYIFEEFKQDFYPGESVVVVLNSGDRLAGSIREKTKFPELLRPDGTIERKAFARYFISLVSRPDDEALVDGDHIVRDRKTFTKQMLRSFLKNSLTRESWLGAPWLVKKRLSDQYRINSTIPDNLQYDQQKAQSLLNRSLKKAEANGGIAHPFQQYGHPLAELRPKSHKGKMSQQDLARAKQEQYFNIQRALDGNAPFGYPRDMAPPDHPHYIHFTTQPGFHAIAAKGTPQPTLPPIKYPIEDLELPPIANAAHRPAMKYLSEDTPCSGRISEGGGSGIRMASVGALLETWDTLNVYCEVFVLDSFTFDDYVEALKFTSEGAQCELLVEVHCAVLKRLVNSERELNGQVQITLPIALQDDSDEGSSRQGSSSGPTPTPEPEFKPRTTRSSIAKTEAAEMKAQAAIDAKLHRGCEIDQCVKGYDWKQRLRKRDFVNGKWIVIIAGLLNLFTANPRFRKTCDEILTQLAPLSRPATEETVISQYATLDINLRVKILQILCMLSLETQAVRSYMEECTLMMTQFRKERLEAQRNRKAALEELRTLHEERVTLQPESNSPVLQLEELDQMEELKVDEPEEEDVVMVSEDEEPVQPRYLRRANDRAAERKRKKEEERKRKEKAEADKANKPTKQARQLERVLKKIEDVMERIREYEEEVATLDNDLRENDCPRTKVLGKDRFWNRYYWFERNAMPYAGLPSSSTADAGYANGCLWVQGPDDIEREGFIELKEEENEYYRAAFRMGVGERKMIEEGPTHTFTAYEWAYYDEPDQLDKLIAWLDVRGVREIKLRKELQAQREKISVHMGKRREYLGKHSEDKPEATETITRVSTRTKTYVDPTGHRCMTWKNSAAMKELGHLHSEPERGPKKGVARISNKKAVFEEEGPSTASEGTGLVASAQIASILPKKDNVVGKVRIKNHVVKPKVQIDENEQSHSPESPLINEIDPELRATFSTGRPMEDKADLIQCKHCKKPMLKAVAASHIQMCLQKKQDRAQRKKEQKEAARKAREARDKGKDEDGDAGMEDTVTLSSTRGLDGADDDTPGTGRKSAVGGNGADKSKKRKADTEGDKEPKKKKTKKEIEAAKPRIPKPKGPVDVEKQCGVLLPNGAFCARSLTCKSHAMGAKRAVPGRSLPYDMLLAAYQKKNQAKQQKAAIDANAPLLDDDDEAGPVNSDEEILAVMVGIARSRPQPLAQHIHVPVRKKYQHFKMKEMMAQAFGGNRTIVSGAGGVVFPGGTAAITAPTPVVDIRLGNTMAAPSGVSVLSGGPWGESNDTPDSKRPNAVQPGGTSGGRANVAVGSGGSAANARKISSSLGTSAPP